MLRILLVFACALGLDFVGGLVPCLAQDEEPVIGFSAGDTVAVTWKFVDPVRPRHAFETTVGWTLRDENAWEFRWMYQRIAHEIKRPGGRRLQVYAAAGLRVKLEDDTRYGLRGALGINFIPSDRQFSPEIFLEAAPARDVSPDHRSHVGLAAGVRWLL